MVETGKTRLHSIDSRSAFEPSSDFARAMSCGYSSKNPGPPEGGVPARWVPGSESRPGLVIQVYQSELRSSQTSGATVGHPMSTWKPAMAAPTRKPEGNPEPFAQAHRMLIAMIALAFMAQGCRENLEPASAGNVQVVFPAF